MSIVRAFRGCVALALLAACGIIGTGCIASAPVNETGIRIGDPTLDQFKAGVTTEAWLVAVLGKPTSWALVEGVEDTKVFRYATVERASGISAVLGGGSGRNTSVTYFIISDGIVTRYWADRAKENTILGKPVEAESGAKQGGGEG